MAKTIDLNCDMGESYGRWTLGADEVIMPFITSANIACGYHGGDPHVMRKTVALALQHKAAVGAPPGEAALEPGRGLILMTLASGKYDATCRKIGCRVASEGFADRAYNVDGTLVSRKLPGALITDPAKAAQQAVKMATTGKVLPLDGVEIDISVQTICCHGDTPGAEKIVRAVREALEK